MRWPWRRRDAEAAPVPVDFGPLLKQIPSLVYKPGWTFTVVERPEIDSGLGLDFTFMVPDVRDATVQVLIGSKVDIPYGNYTEEAWTRFLFEAILQAEHHEAGEFFTVDGRRPYDPHAVPA